MTIGSGLPIRIVSQHMKTAILTMMVLAGALTARAQLHTESIEYKHGETTLEGWLAYDASIKGKRPGVLIVHQWKGLSDYEQNRAAMLAKLGYVVFAVDIYGKGIRPTNPKDAGAEAGKYKSNRALLRARVQAGLAILKHQALTDPRHVAAIGYCFGGTTVVELARSGADIAGVVSFHGGLDSPKPEDGKHIKCKVLALHGADDPFVPAKDLVAFEAEMKESGVDYQLVKYPGAVHSFTDWNAGNDNSKGAAYNKAADEQSWEAMKQFLAKIFK